MLGRLVTMLVSALMFTLIGTGAVPANAVNIGQRRLYPRLLEDAHGELARGEAQRPVQRQVQ